MKLNLAPARNLAVPPSVEVPGLQALKLLCAFLVVVIHTAALQGGPLRVVASVAVPVFFMITGFFCVDPRGCLDACRLGRMIWKLLLITVGAQAAYIAFYVLKCRVEATAPDDLFHLRSWVTLIAVGDKFGGHLWYLTAAIEALAVVWCAVKLRMERLLFLLIPAGLALGLLAGAYAPLLGHDAAERFIHRNFITLGLPCILIGIAMRRRPLLSARPALLWAATAVVLLLMLAEHYGLRLSPRGDFIILTVPAAMLLFQSFARINPPALLAAAGRSYATGIYIAHLIVMWALAQTVAALAPSPWLAPATFLATLLILILWRRLRGHLPLRRPF